MPRRGAVGDQVVPAIRSVMREAGTGKPRFVVDVAVQPGADVALFVEGPTPEWALPLPQPVAGASEGLQRFAFELDGLPPGGSAAGAVLRLTAVSGEQAVEASFRLD